MTKQEILGVMCDPRIKVRHESFQIGNWMRRSGTGNSYEFYGGHSITVEKFWESCDLPYFEDHWEIVD